MPACAAATWRCGYGDGSDSAVTVGNGGSRVRRLFFLGAARMPTTCVGVAICRDFFATASAWARRRTSVSLLIRRRRKPTTSSLRNTHPLPIRVPGSSPVRAYWTTVSGSAFKSAATPSNVNVSQASIMVCHRSVSWPNTVMSTPGPFGFVSNSYHYFFSNGNLVSVSAFRFDKVRPRTLIFSRSITSGTF